MRLLIIAIAASLGLGLGVADSAGSVSVLWAGPGHARRHPHLAILSRAAELPTASRGAIIPETVFILKLDEPICVSGDPSSRLNPKSHSRVTEVQLVTRGVDPKRFVNKQVRASGSFFGAHMAYHRTPVVLTVVKLRAA